MKKKIFLADDDKDLISFLSSLLEENGYITFTAQTTETALNKIKKSLPDLILLDIRMPSIGGIELCRILKKNKKTRAIPVIMLTVQNSPVDKVIGLEIGADDYITKPFDERELLARIKALFRRLEYKEEKDVLKTKNIKIKVDERIVFISGEPVKLMPKEFDLLLTFVKNKNKALSREYLVETVWGYEYFGTSRTLDTTIKRLRKKLGAEAKRIETITGIGYRFVEE